MSPTRRAAPHRTAAELLRPRADGRDEFAGTVARHWQRDCFGRPRQSPGRCGPRRPRTTGAHDKAASSSTNGASTRSSPSGTDPAELLFALVREQRYLCRHASDSLDTCELAADEGERTGRAEIIGRSAVMIQSLEPLWIVACFLLQ